jgi:hypothetical protein
MKLDVKALALACGLLWGFGLLILTWWVIMLEGPSRTPTFIGLVYRGYSFSFVGSLIGFVWAFFDGLIGGAVLGWLYNLIAARSAKA